MSFQISDRPDVNETLCGISREQFWLQVHQLDFAHSVLIDYYLAFEVSCKVKEYFFFS